MSFKMKDQQCERVVRGQPEEVYAERLGQLYAKISLETGQENIYRLQGQIFMLLEVISLKEKANNQLKMR